MMIIHTRHHRQFTRVLSQKVNFSLNFIIFYNQKFFFLLADIASKNNIQEFISMQKHFKHGTLMNHDDFVKFFNEF
jgi:hypothetical protein